MEQAEATRLWQRFSANDDESAFAALYREYRLSVMRYCRARTHDEEAGGDITNRLFVYLWYKRPTCTRSFESMLFFYARLRCLNYRALPRLQSLPEVKARNPGPSAALEQEGESRRIDQALCRLANDQREVLLAPRMCSTPRIGFCELSEHWLVGAPHGRGKAGLPYLAI